MIPPSPADAAIYAVRKAQAAGFDVDDPRGADLAFAAIADLLTGLALPGEGETLTRWTALASVGAVDVTLGRLAEAHADAVAILHELTGRPPTEALGQRWGGLGRRGASSHRSRSARRVGLRAGRREAVVRRGSALHSRARHRRRAKGQSAVRGRARRPAGASPGGQLERRWIGRERDRAGRVRRVAGEAGGRDRRIFE